MLTAVHTNTLTYLYTKDTMPILRFADNEAMLAPEVEKC